MDHLSSELSKLKIDRSQRNDQPSSRKAIAVAVVVIVLVLAGVFAVFALRNSSASAEVETVRPRTESASSSAVLVATGYVVAHHKIQVGSKISVGSPGLEWKKVIASGRARPSSGLKIASIGPSSIRAKPHSIPPKRG